ncbi:NAD(P)H-dependent glycerol-3-phosphate dehydrogenase [Luteipulveratus mongoliensis]|uniref:Glycerol-3-phosphate dehydrogenase [NAD(P)+] n=1 Tax=Luteipulveratus mongoliensis TaxID=571913 RepID=A0A0K1JNP1_9MICO|nr:NAD(P)H-dependent glycerol-3-phosphate dehydrogenase [Luteipulveratus mongoliensis]AKU18339.1 glycerol-3-phosphate acyltransferase [Luteipulveratus mongoliensis]
MASRNPRVTVLGGGSWGTTIGSLAARNTETVLWARNEETVTDINERSRNSRYLQDIPVTKTLRATTDLEEAVAEADVLVLGVPSQHSRGVLEQVTKHVRPWVPVVSLVKGLEQGSSKRMTAIVEEVMPGHPAGVLAGPNIAREVLQGYAAAATIAMPEHRQAEMLQELFRTNLFRVYTTTDVTGVEYAGSLKNVYAIAVGVGDGLEAGDNTRAMVITRALREMTRLGVSLGGDAMTFNGLAGMGDLIATCTSPFSRNRTVGVGLAQGKSLDQIAAEMNQVAEGVKTVATVMKLAAEQGIDLPIAREMDAVLNHGQPVKETYRGLLRQAPGHEVHGDEW